MEGDVNGEMMEEETEGEDGRGEERDSKWQGVGWKGEKDRVQVQEFMTYSIDEVNTDVVYILKPFHAVKDQP